MLSRISYLLWFSTLAIAAYLFIHFTRDDSGPNATYIGVERCRSCHESVRSGEQYRLWTQSSHARAYTALASDSAIAYMQRHNVTVEACMACHTTLGRPAVNDAERALNSQGVGCERCHGPGSAYAFFKIMKDEGEFTSRGGVVGSTGDCYQCHVQTLSAKTNHCPFQTSDFDAKQSWKAINHPVRDREDESDTLTQRSHE